MRVVDITGWFSSGAGGIKTYYQAKACHMPATGIDCHFVVPAAENDEQRFGAATLHGIAGPPMPRDPNYRLMTDVGRLRSLLRALAPDVIEIASHFVLPDLVRWAIRGLPRRPALVGFYHADVPHAYVGPRVAHMGRSLTDRSVDAAFAWVRRRHAAYRATLVASRTVESMLRARSVPGVVHVGLGVDLATFRPRPAERAAEPTVVYAGRLNGEKDIGSLLEAWQRLPARLGAHLVVAGSGPLVGLLDGRRGVSFVGYVSDRQALARRFAHAWAVVVPGAHETFSLIAAEALASGTPIVASDRGAAAELARLSGGGVTFRAHDAGALSAALASVLELPAAAREMLGACGRRHAERELGWPLVCARIADVYRAVA